MTKIEALKQTIYNLENNIYEYNWIEADSCNCGILARTLLNGESIWKNGFADSVHTGKGAFAAKAHCITTGLPIPKVFQILKETGFTYEELLELEYLSNYKITNRAKMATYFNEMLEISVNQNYSDKNILIVYLKEWIRILKEQQPREDITKQLAIIPLDKINESPDIINNKILTT